MTLNSYLSIVTLNMNGLNDPIKRCRVSDRIKSKTRLFVVYKRLILDLRTRRARKLKVGEPFTIQMVLKRKLG